MEEDSGIEPKGNQGSVLDATADELKIEAVAGSGKTTTLVWRIRDEIRKRETPPNRILVLTFANEATESIRERLTDELGPTESFAVDVYNYHSFCYRLLRDYAYYAGLSPEFELITEQRRRSVLDSVREDVDFGFASSAETDAERSGVDALGSFIEAMRRESVMPAAIREYLPPDETVRKLHQLVRDIEDAARRLVATTENDRTDHPESLARNCERLARVYRGQAARFDAPHPVETAVAEFLEAMAGCADSVAGQLATADTPSWLECRAPEALFLDERGGFAGVKQTPMGRLTAFVDMLRRARAYVPAYESYFEELRTRGALDYDDLIDRAVSLLGDDAVRDEILSRWDVVFCDEFQDTDESQLGLVEELRAATNIVVVGDSDQAIHEWRGQDPENMAKLPDSFTEIDLPDNFRSRQAILDLTNNLGRSTQRIRSRRPPDPPSVFKVESGAGETEKRVATTVSNLLSGRFPDLAGHDAGDIAVLVRGNHHARRIARELERESIPCSLAKHTDGVSEGVETVVSYLRVLVTPGDDVSWQRVLLLVYRVSESDIDAVLAAGETVPAGYEALARSAFETPDRLAEAMADYDALRAISATGSVSEVYRHLKRETHVEWFLRETDRNALASIERLVSSFTESRIEAGLTPAFVSYLDREAERLTDGTATSGGSRSPDAVDVMTIHQAKGLDFDTVLLPFLTEDEFGGPTMTRYQSVIHSYDVLVDAIGGDLDEPLRADVSEDAVTEEWRVLHVALTRAKDHLFLFGEASDEASAVSLLDRHLGGDSAPIHWSAAGARLPVWSELMDSYDAVAAAFPNAVCEYTEAVTRGVDEDRGTITYYERDLSTAEAIETALGFADRFVERTLPTDGIDTARDADTPLGVEPTTELARQHSHTALEAARECGRRHVLDFVVDAFADPVFGGSDRGTDHADIGSLFHDVAEVAYWRGYSTPAEWREACEWLAESRDCTHVVSETVECIETYFETDAADWNAVGAEVPIELDVAEVAGTVTGYVDSVRERPGGSLAVLDYKTSRARKSLENSQQLLLYVRACADRFEREVSHAGYVYVGEAGPATQLFSVADLEDGWDALRADLRRADATTFADAEPGPHCRYCRHRSLGCPDAEFADDFLVE